MCMQAHRRIVRIDSVLSVSFDRRFTQVVLYVKGRVQLLIGNFDFRTSFSDQFIFDSDFRF